MVEVKKKKNETFEALLRRFNKRILQSGKIIQFKKIRFHKRKQNRNLRRASALFRKDAKEQREYLKKIGRLPEEETLRSR